MVISPLKSNTYLLCKQSWSHIFSKKQVLHKLQVWFFPPEPESMICGAGGFNKDGGGYIFTEHGYKTAS